MKYDYLIVGGGLYGAVCSYELTKKGYKVLVIDKRSHIGGNVYTESTEGINVHKYGAHIFHTSDKAVWDYVNGFAEFNNFVNSPIAVYNGEVYNLPFNMNTFSRLFGVITPDQARQKIEEERKESYTENPENLEQQAINLVGKTVYEKLIKGYTEKQWGRSCKSLPAFIIKRIPVRFTYDNNYFNDRYQGIPIGGYTKMVEKMLVRADVKLNCDYFSDREGFNAIADKIIYSGPIDRFFDFSLGALEYRTVSFETEIIDKPDYQGNAVVNYTDASVPYTRIIEHKHFEPDVITAKTVISREYSRTFTVGAEPYYPVNDAKNSALYEEYAKLASELEKVHFGGRLGTYKYLDMDKIIKAALTYTDGIPSKNQATGGCDD